ncbi:MAG: LysM peptidoglycan-binding domain-containing protein [Candidatus Obscuribacterales bacterium]|nr:LysM peptidoglycan-binding domain-containing protein [Candidatus Obscuribacterales bacterium]
MSIDSNPSFLGGGGDLPQAAISAADAGAAQLSAESQLTSHADIAAARQFFQPASGAGLATPSFTTGAESAAVAAKAGAESTAIAGAVKSIGSLTAGMGVGEAAAMGAHAMAGGAAAAAEVSPMIQLIMKLPGLGGVAQSFFEWLAALFVTPGNLTDVFDPAMWARLGESVHGGLNALATHGVSAEHFNVPLSMLPGNAPFLQQLSLQTGQGISDLQRISGSLSGGLSNGISQHGFSSNLNISGPLDLKKAQFEMAPANGSGVPNMHLDGKFSGPELSNNLSSSHLAGTQRMFSDQVSNQQSLLSQSSSQGANSFVSNASSPAPNSNLNISSNSFGNQEVGSMPANFRMSDGVMSGPSVSNNIGYHLSDAAPAAADKAQSLLPSGGVSDTLGGKDLIASNEVAPSFGGSYFKPAGLPTGESSAAAGADSGMTGLKAEPMSLLKKPAGIGHTPDRGAVDQIGHQSKGNIHATSSSSNNHAASSAAQQHGSMDQISHRGQHAVEAHKHIASKQVSGDAHPKHIAKTEAAKPQVRVEAAKAPAAQEQYAQQAPEQQTAPEQNQQIAAEQQSVGDGSLERSGNYTVQHGDNLWDIARKQLGDGSRWTEIYKLNSDVIGSNPHLIHGGLDLKMPGADSTQITDASAAGDYTVQPGDNLWDIAKGKLGDGSRWGEIYDANKAVIGQNPSLIYSGTHLQMPGAQTISQAAPAQAPMVDPNAMPAQQMAPQAMAPQNAAAPAEGYFQAQPAPQELSYVPQQNLGGPGAAAAATLDASQMPNAGPVSPSLAPDLSFLYGNGKSN